MIYDDSLSSVPCSNGSREQPVSASLTRQDGVQVFPNPSAGQFTLLLRQADGAQQPARVSVINARGQVVVESELPPNSLEYPLDLGNQPAGLYWVQVSQSAAPPQSVKISIVR